MSVQFGRWNLDGRAVDSQYLARVYAALAPYGPDGGNCYDDTNISILYHAFHTTKESRGEVQPHTSESGAVITWDGRLDNRTDLIGELRDSLTVQSTDLAIVATAYEKWGTDCLAKLLGDWAVSIWDPKNKSLTLAKDPVGVRHLYYCFDNNQISWSTILDPLVRLAGKTFALNDEYIAGWLSMFPAVHLTPYVGVHSVPSSSFVLLRPGRHAVSRFWDFDPEAKIRYRSDFEYEEHFRVVFRDAVRRKLRSDRPVLAELSGGRDSSSIVCMADELINGGTADTPSLDTISYFDDSEPNWNERPFFTKVEEKRGRSGCHIDIGAQNQGHIERASPEFLHDPFVQTPGHNGRTSPPIRMCMASKATRVLLSGIGGDEVMGGVPTPRPELEDLLASAQFGAFARQLKAWALEKRKPWLHLFWEAARGFFPPSLVGVPKHMRPIPWLQGAFVKQHWNALAGYPFRTKLLGAVPSFQDNLSTLDALRRQLARTALPFEPPYEKRYPFLDLSLLEFVFAIPREQLIRPNQRRSLMRRALRTIVPDEVLNRKRKGTVVRAPNLTISKDWARIVAITQNMVSDSLGIVDSERISEALQKARRGEEVHVTRLIRTIYIEEWLQHLRDLGVVNLDPSRP